MQGKLRGAHGGWHIQRWAQSDMKTGAFIRALQTTTFHHHGKGHPHARVRQSGHDSANNLITTIMLNHCVNDFRHLTYNTPKTGAK